MFTWKYVLCFKVMTAIVIKRPVKTWKMQRLDLKRCQKQSEIFIHGI